MRPSQEKSLIEKDIVQLAPADAARWQLCKQQSQTMANSAQSPHAPTISGHPLEIERENVWRIERII